MNSAFSGRGPAVRAASACPVWVRRPWSPPACRVCARERCCEGPVVLLVSRLPSAALRHEFSRAAGWLGLGGRPSAAGRLCQREPDALDRHCHRPRRPAQCSPCAARFRNLNPGRCGAQGASRPGCRSAGDGRGAGRWGGGQIRGLRGPGVKGRRSGDRHGRGRTRPRWSGTPGVSTRPPDQVAEGTGRTAAQARADDLRTRTEGLHCPPQRQRPTWNTSRSRGSVCEVSRLLLCLFLRTARR